MSQRYWPLEAGHIVTSWFGPRGDEFHWGTDFGWEGGSAGRPVFAVQSGTVIFAGPADGYGGPDPAGWVVVDSADDQGGGCVEYGHIVREVRAGQHVTAGQRIAHINPHPETNGGVPPHLHLSVMPLGYDPYAKFDPVPWLASAAFPTEGPPPVDSLFADVSYFQTPVDDSYPHGIFSFRSNDGTFRDPNFEHNYQWACRAADSGKIACFVVYLYWRPNWSDTVATHMDMVLAQGGPHPRMISMIDLESGGNPGGDQSVAINRSYHALAGWLRSKMRVIGYANTSDFNTMWPTRPTGLRVIGAGYGRNPNLPGQIAHQYTDGRGYGGGLPEGAPPFGNCDMNAANGLTPQQFAAACGVATEDFMPALNDDEQRELLGKTREIWDQLRGPDGQGWPQLGQDAQGHNRTPVDTLGAIAAIVEEERVTGEGK